jgi:hypothetical protein
MMPSLEVGARVLHTDKIDELGAEQPDDTAGVSGIMIPSSV